MSPRAARLRWTRSTHWVWRAAAATGALAGAAAALGVAIARLGATEGTRLLWFLGILVLAALAVSLVSMPSLTAPALIGLGAVLVAALAGPSDPGTTLLSAALLAVAVELADVSILLRSAIREDAGSLGRQLARVTTVVLLATGGCAALLLVARVAPPTGAAAAAVVAAALLIGSGLVWWSRAR